MSIRARIGLGFALCVAIVLALAALALRGARSQADADRCAARSLQVLDQVEGLMNLALDSETGARGYALTGNEAFLEPQDLAEQRLLGQVRDLRELTLDNPAQQRRIDALTRLARERLAESAQIVEARRRGDREAAAALVETGRGKAITDQFRSVVAQMREEENRLLSERIATAAAQTRGAMLAIGLGSIASLAVAAAGTVLLGRSIAGPARVLALGAERVGAGDLEHPLDVARRDELGQLAVAFNRMMEQLREAAADNARLYGQVVAEGERLHASLHEKDVLIREVHHRVKNNLQVITSLLELQARHAADSGARELIRESQRRVRTIALVHEKIYQSSDLGSIDFAAYLKSLVRTIVSVYDASARGVVMEAESDDVRLGIDAAMHCGLIVNELVGNAVKHAFHDGRTGAIEVTLRREADALVLRVRDDGIGFPAGLDFRRAPSLGLQLVCSLTEQLGGVVTMARDAGTAFTVRFPPADPRG